MFCRVGSIYVLALAGAMAFGAVTRADTPPTGTIAGRVTLIARVSAPLRSSAYPTRAVGVPAGRYTLVGWHERVVPVQIQPRRKTTINLTVPVEDLR